MRSDRPVLLLNACHPERERDKRAPLGEKQGRRPVTPSGALRFARLTLDGDGLLLLELGLPYFFGTAIFSTPSSNFALMSSSSMSSPT